MEDNTTIWLRIGTLLAMILLVPIGLDYIGVGFEWPLWVFIPLILIALTAFGLHLLKR